MKNLEDKGERDWRMLEWWDKKPYTERAIHVLNKVVQSLRRTRQNVPFPVTFKAADGLIGVRSMREVFEDVPRYVDFAVVDEPPPTGITDNLVSADPLRIRRYEFDRQRSMLAEDVKILVYTEVKESV